MSEATYRPPTEEEIEEAVSQYETILVEMGKIDDCGLTLQDHARLWLQAWLRVTGEKE